jgi:hypothetical protein
MAEIQIDRRLFVTRLASGLCAALFLPKLVVPGWKIARTTSLVDIQIYDVVGYKWVPIRELLFCYWSSMTHREWTTHYEDMIKKQTSPIYQPTDDQLARRNAEAMAQIKRHPKLKAESRAYQEGGAFYGRAEDGGGLVDQLYRKSE